MPSPKIFNKAPKISPSNSDSNAHFTSSTCRKSSPNSTPTLTPRIPAGLLTPTGTSAVPHAVPSRGRYTSPAASTGTLQTLSGDALDGEVGPFSSGASLTRVSSDPTTGTQGPARADVKAPGSEGSRTPSTTYITGPFEDFLEESDQDDERPGFLGASLGRRRNRSSSRSGRSKSPPTKPPSNEGSPSGKDKGKAKKPSPLSTSNLPLFQQNRLKGSDTPPDAPPSSWWGRYVAEDEGISSPKSPRTPEDPGEFPYRARGFKKKRKPELDEKLEDSSWRRTRERVSKAASAVFGSTAADVVHELLVIGSELAELAPVPGLEPAAKLLLNLWDNLEGVDTNHQACLRLVEHGAEILLRVTEEIHEVGEDTVGRELERPIERLTEAFKQIQTLLLSLARRPFLKRYLKREEIKLEIELCEKGLTDAVTMFGLGIQIRVLRGVLEGLGRQTAIPGAVPAVTNGGEKTGAEKLEEATLDTTPIVRQRTLDPLVEDAKEDLSGSQMTVTPLADVKDPFAAPAAAHGDGTKTPRRDPISLDNHIPPNAISNIAPSASPISIDNVDPAVLGPLLSSLILSSIRSDSRQLAALLKQTLATGRDEEIMKITQVGRDEMLEAIVALRREHERWEDKWREREEQIKNEKEEMLRNLKDATNEEGRRQGRPVLGRTISAVSKMSRRSSGGGAKPKPPQPPPPPARRTSSSGTARPHPVPFSPSRKPTALSSTTSASSPGVTRQHSTSTAGTGSSIEHVKHPSSASATGSSLEDEREVARTLRKEDEEEEMATLHREFIEGSIDAFRRLSRQAEDLDRKRGGSSKRRKSKGRGEARGRGSTRKKVKRESEEVDGAGVGGLPSWTITRYEVDRERKIGIGFFSDVYKGAWRPPYPIVPTFHTSANYVSSNSSRPSTASSSTPSTSSSHSSHQILVVAIKVLSPLTPRELFLREAKIWKSLPPHPNVLELYGASSTTGDPPWFFVCPYLMEGNLVGYLKRLPGVDYEGNGGLGLSFGKGGDHPRPTIANDGDWSVISPVLMERSTSGGTTTGSMLSPAYPIWNSRSQNSGPPIPRESDLHRFMLEIATGMEHLHRHKVYHGDLKASNILVDDQLRCVISDFGQSEMKSEAYRLSGTPARPHGTLRWQAPELMSGANPSTLTPQMDVYAFAICCVEILGMGRLPWPQAEDDAVRNFILKENIRPPMPSSLFSIPEILGLLQRCWDRAAEKRPTFGEIVRDTRALRKSFHQHRKGGAESLGDTPSQASAPLPIPGTSEFAHEGVWGRKRISPDMRPGPLPLVDSRDTPETGSSPLSMPSTDDTYHSAQSELLQLGVEAGQLSISEKTIASRVRMPVPVIYTPNPASSSSSSSASSSPSIEPAKGDIRIPSHILQESTHFQKRTESPPPRDDRTLFVQDERRYRLLLSQNHTFHPSLTLPQWNPIPVELGAVGYLSKDLGSFITLFNAFHPERADEEETRGLPSLRGYGKVQKRESRTDKRSSTQRGLDAIVGWLTFRTRGHGSVQKVSRRYSYPLRAGKKAAYVCAETTVYGYMETLEVPKKWFKLHANAILQIYEERHHIQREDLFLIIGKLDSPDHGLFVSHNHPDGQVRFNVYSNPPVGHPWGTWTTDRHLPHDLGGPTYDEPIQEESRATAKVSKIGDPWATLLLARLRFKPDVVEPTSI